LHLSKIKITFFGGTLKALVTGGTGFIGSHLADYLLNKGFEVRCIYRKTSNIRWLKDKSVELVEASLNDITSLIKACEGVDYIFHVAGLVAAKNEKEFLTGNRDATRNLLEAAKIAVPNLKRFLYVSSQTAAGPSASLNGIKTESMERNPITAYGRSKKAAEDEVLKFKDIFPITIVRPPAVIGPRDPASYQIFQVANKGFGTLMGFKPKYANLIYSSDLVEGIFDAAMSENSIGKTYFLASEEIYNWNQILAAMKKHLNKNFFIYIKIPHFLIYSIAGLSELFGKFSKKPPVFNFDKGRDFVQEYWTCSVNEAKKDFGYKQKVNLDEAIKKSIEWYKENKWL